MVTTVENPMFRLEGVVKDKNGEQDFEGPLSLILMLLSKNKIEIRDINISEILAIPLESLVLEPGFVTTARPRSLKIRISSSVMWTQW